MSRTYRKNLRWIEKYQGEFYHWGVGNTPSIKYPFKVKNGIDLPMGTAFSRIVLDVGDGDNWASNKANWSVKRMHHKIDRARFKQALLRNEDAVINPSYDPWDWD